MYYWDLFNLRKIKLDFGMKSFRILYRSPCPFNNIIQVVNLASIKFGDLRFSRWSWRFLIWRFQDFWKISTWFWSKRFQLASLFQNRLFRQIKFIAKLTTCTVIYSVNLWCNVRQNNVQAKYLTEAKSAQRSKKCESKKCSNKKNNRSLTFDGEGFLGRLPREDWREK